VTTTVRVVVKVTAEDIAHGVKNDCERCPIARALWRAIPGASPVVGGVSASWHDGAGSWVRVTLPASARGFVSDFDGRLPVAPFSFPLDIPVPDPTEAA